MRVRKVLKCCKQNLLGDPYGSLKGKNTARNIQITKTELKYLLGVESEAIHSYYIMAKNLSSICLWTENLSKTGLKMVRSA